VSSELVTPLSLNNLVAITLSLITLSIATFKDIKSREIDLWVWLIPTPAILINLYILVISKLSMSFRLITVLLSLLPALITFFLALLNLMGGADFLAFLVLGLANVNLLFFKTIPIALLVFVITAILMIVYPLRYFFSNIFRWRNELSKLNIPTLKKVAMAFIGRPVKVKEYFNMKFHYPLTLYEVVNDRLMCNVRLNFKIDEEPEEHIRKLKELINNGFINEETIIWVTYGIPTIPIILVSYVISLILIPLIPI